MTSEDGGVSIETAFELLKQGKTSQTNEDHWQAANKFLQAREILQKLTETEQEGVDNKEKQKILDLYSQKAQEYWHESRKSLLEAMTKEASGDEKELTPVCAELSDEDAEARIRTFSVLFSKPMSMSSYAAVPPDLSQQQWSIEERLQELNASLPSGFKTDSERMDSINRGLNRLGLSLYTQKEPFARFQEELPKDEDEQIDEILAQAKDEVAFDRKFGPASTVGPSAASPDSDDDEEEEDDDSDDDDGDLLLEDDQLAMKRIRRKVVRAQVKLVEMVALLDEAKAAKENEEDDTDDHKSDDGDSIEKPSVESFLASGKKKLTSARSDLKKALQEWVDGLH